MSYALMDNRRRIKKKKEKRGHLELVGWLVGCIPVDCHFSFTGCYVAFTGSTNNKTDANIAHCLC